MFASSQYIGQNAVANTGGVQPLGHFRHSRADDGLLCGKASLDLTVRGGGTLRVALVDCCGLTARISDVVK